MSVDEGITAGASEPQERIRGAATQTEESVPVELKTGAYTLAALILLVAVMLLIRAMRRRGNGVPPHAKAGIDLAEDRSTSKAGK